jgi:hypothetical protein
MILQNIKKSGGGTGELLSAQRSWEISSPKSICASAEQTPFRVPLGLSLGFAFVWRLYASIFPYLVVIAPPMRLFWHFSPGTGGLLLVRGSREAVRHLQRKPHIEQKTYSQGRGITPGGVGGWTKGQDWCPTCPIVQVILKGSKPVARCPPIEEHRPRTDACTVKTRGEECGDLRFF